MTKDLVGGFPPQALTRPGVLNGFLLAAQKKLAPSAACLKYLSDSGKVNGNPPSCGILAGTKGGFQKEQHDFEHNELTEIPSRSAGPLALFAASILFFAGGIVFGALGLNQFAAALLELIGAVCYIFCLANTKSSYPHPHDEKYNLLKEPSSSPSVCYRSHASAELASSGVSKAVGDYARSSAAKNQRHVTKGTQGLFSLNASSVGKIISTQVKIAQPKYQPEPWMMKRGI